MCGVWGSITPSLIPHHIYLSPGCIYCSLCVSVCEYTGSNSGHLPSPKPNLNYLTGINLQVHTNNIDDFSSLAKEFSTKSFFILGSDTFSSLLLYRIEENSIITTEFQKAKQTWPQDCLIIAENTCNMSFGHVRDTAYVSAAQKNLQHKCCMNQCDSCCQLQISSAYYAPTTCKILPQWSY